MALTAAVIVPNVLRWHWWRLNGWGYAYGTLGGILLSLIVLLFPGLPDYVVFPTICLASLAACVIGSLVTAPTSKEVLRSFFESVRPFGWRSGVRS